MKLSTLLDSVTLAAVSAVLLGALYLQVWDHEMPCALCNLERAGYMIFAGGLVLNLTRGEASGSNYIISAIGALIGSLVALLQMFVHVLPGTPPTGNTVFGLHLYPIAYASLTASLVYCIAMLWLMPRLKEISVGSARAGRPIRLVVALFVALTFANLLSVFLENGLHPMKAGGQQHYQMLYSGDVMKP